MGAQSCGLGRNVGDAMLSLCFTELLLANHRRPERWFWSQDTKYGVPSGFGASRLNLHFGGTKTLFAFKE